jgi:hypothetical protein
VRATVGCLNNSKFSVFLLFSINRFEANGDGKLSLTRVENPRGQGRLQEPPEQEACSPRASLAEWLARRKRWLPSSPPTHPSSYLYGVGAGDSAGDGEGDSVAPSVFGGVFFAALCFRGGVGVGLAAAGAVVAVVPCCCVQEATNATPIKALIKTTMCFFIGC